MKIEILHKEIDLIQDCISRMANNSFLLKGWLISILAVILALAEKQVNFLVLSTILIIPVLSFWYLDAYYLCTERKYRALYNWVLENRPKNKDLLYNLNHNRFENLVESIPEVMLSPTLRIFYGIPALILILTIVFNLLKFFQIIS
ncbi:hypothetical protein CH381_30855 [Leptospira sp. mixed culture ATI2-C-A1]|nr:hypothetical protein CH381_30855 [Leptospira sp. mixed culture ATI2-C-A1]